MDIKYIHEEITKCDCCYKQAMELKIFEYDIPNFGLTNFISSGCTICGFKNVTRTPIFDNDNKKGIKIKIEIKDALDLEYDIIISDSTIVRVESLNCELSFFDNQYTTIQDILDKIIEYNERLNNDKIDYYGLILDLEDKSGNLKLIYDELPNNIIINYF